MVFVIDGCEVIGPGGKSVYGTVRLHGGLDRVDKSGFGVSGRVRDRVEKSGLG